jgi:hypothetical protein
MAKSLPRSIDVQITLTKPQSELATDMTLACLLTTTAIDAGSANVGLAFGLYTDFESFAVDFPSTTTAYYAGQAFFAQPTHPLRLAVGIIAAVGSEGYDLAAEIATVQAAAIAAGHKVYCWLLDSDYRDAGDDQEDLADYCLAAERQICVLCSNSTDVYGAGTSDIAAVLQADGNTAATVIYHDVAQQFPDAAYAAILLGVNYGLQGSTLTMKFKDLTGITTTALTETQLSALEAKGCNAFVLVGNNSRVIHSGTQAATTWYSDLRVNLDNLCEELQTAVYNVFLRTPKVPYTPVGVAMIVSACTDILEKYKFNGTLADRQLVDLASKQGYSIAPAYLIEPEPLQLVTASERAARTGPPIKITCYEEGAIHSVAINIGVIQ